MISGSRFLMYWEYKGRSHALRIFTVESYLVFMNAFSFIQFAFDVSGLDGMKYLRSDLYSHKIE